MVTPSLKRNTRSSLSPKNSMKTTPEWFGIPEDRVLFWSMDFDVSLALSEQNEDLLNEDLAQISIRSDAIVDLGWYPQSSRAGALVLMLVEQQNWDEPIVREEFSNLCDLKNFIQKLLHNQEVR